MSARARLQVGIPTYNFGAFIGETLASIVPQLKDDEVIVVLDGGSTDNTPTIMADWCTRVPAIRYVRQDRRGGIDADMARVVELADAEYVWLFSADDIMLPGALCKARDLLAENCDVYLLVHADSTIDLRVIHDRHPVLAGDSRVMQIGEPIQRLEYLRSALSTEALFSFMGGLIVRRDSWAPQRSTDDLFYGSCWAHAARLLRAASDGHLRVGYHADPLLLRRGDNDSFRTEGAVKRFALAIDGYQNIVTAVFGADSEELALTQRILSREFGLLPLLDCKAAASRNPLSEDVTQLDRLVASIHRDGWHGWLIRSLYRLAPSLPLQWLIALKRRLRGYGATA